MHSSAEAEQLVSDPVLLDVEDGLSNCSLGSVLPADNQGRYQLLWQCIAANTSAVPHVPNEYMDCFRFGKQLSGGFRCLCQ